MDEVKGDETMKSSRGETVDGRDDKEEGRNEQEEEEVVGRDQQEVAERREDKDEGRNEQQQRQEEDKGDDSNTTAVIQTRQGRFEVNRSK